MTTLVSSVGCVDRSNEEKPDSVYLQSLDLRSTDVEKVLHCDLNIAWRRLA